MGMLDKLKESSIEYFNEVMNDLTSDVEADELISNIIDQAWEDFKKGTELFKEDEGGENANEKYKAFKKGYNSAVHDQQVNFKIMEE